MKPGLISDQSTPVIRFLNIYLWIAMLGLLLQGMASLFLRLSTDLQAITPPLIAGVLVAHIPHAFLHIGWGTLGVLVLLLFRSSRASLILGFAFGAFYTLLAIYGLFDSYAFGLQLVPSEEIFHLVVGPLTLIVSFLALYLLFAFRGRQQVSAS